MNDQDHRQLSANSCVIRTARPTDTDAVGTLLEESYSRLLAASYDSTILGLALPYMIKANPALLASGTYYVAEAERRIVVGCGGWTAEKPGSNDITAGEEHI